MRALIFLIFAGGCLSAATLPDLVHSRVRIKETGRDLLSGGTTITLATNQASVYWVTNRAISGYYPVYTVSQTPIKVAIDHPERLSFDGSTIRILGGGPVSIKMVFSATNGQTYSRAINFADTTIIAPATNYAFVSNVVGSLSHHIRTNLTARMRGGEADRRPLFTTCDVAATNYIRNPSCFLADVDGLESYIAGNDTIHHMMNGCLISPRHILSVYHIGSQLNQIVFFVNRTNNSVIARRVIDFVRVNGADQTVAVLDAPLPPTIVPAQILTNAYAKIPEYRHQLRWLGVLPMLAFNQDRRPAVNICTAITSGTNAAFNVSPNPVEVTAPWQQNMRGGDSGSPTYFIIHNRLCVVGSMTSVMAGTAVGQIAVDLQSSMNFLCRRNGFTNETLSVVDTSGFTPF